jgi:C-5 cytosine-specific DNA methylase
MKPLAIDLCCGSGGWAAGLLAEGWNVIGFDIVQQRLYPGQQVIQDVRTIDGTRLYRAGLIVASPPCEEFSRHDQPWTRAKNPPPPDLSIVEACRRIAVQAGVSMILENVRGAQKFIGRSNFRLQGTHLWGKMPALMPDFEPPRQKQTQSSTARLERARIPYELACYIARVFKPQLSTK